jgi:hypothetical protein
MKKFKIGQRVKVQKFNTIFNAKITKVNKYTIHIVTKQGTNFDVSKSKVLV